MLKLEAGDGHSFAVHEWDTYEDISKGAFRLILEGADQVTLTRDGVVELLWSVPGRSEDGVPEDIEITSYR